MDEVLFKLSLFLKILGFDLAFQMYLQLLSYLYFRPPSLNCIIYISLLITYTKRTPIKTVECHVAFFGREEEVQPNNHLYKNEKKNIHLHIQIIHPFGINAGYTLIVHSYRDLRR